MEVEISTSDPDAVDPEAVAEALGAWFVLSVSVNEGERRWENPEAAR